MACVIFSRAYTGYMVCVIFTPFTYAAILKKFSFWRNIQFKIDFLTKNGYFPQINALQAIWLKKMHFLNF